MRGVFAPVIGRRRKARLGPKTSVHSTAHGTQAPAGGWYSHATGVQPEIPDLFFGYCLTLFGPF